MFAVQCANEASHQTEKYVVLLTQPAMYNHIASINLGTVNDLHNLSK